jgi:hypothetical protein
MRNFLKITAGIIVAILVFQNCQKSDFLVVTGVVRDSITNKPIEGVAIISPSGKAFKTSSDGTFSINGIQAGKQTFRVIGRWAEYESKTKTFIISDGRINKLDFDLAPIPIPDVETGNVTKTGLTSATVSGTIHLKNGVTAFRYGHCWSITTKSPTVDDCLQSTSYYGGAGTINFTSNLTNLSDGVIYYIKSYVVTSNGAVIYGDRVAYKHSIFDLDEGLILHLPINNDLIDYSGYAHTVWTDYGYPSFISDRFGETNKACRFVSNSNIYGRWGLSNINDFSVSFWLSKLNNWEDFDQYMFLIGEGTDNQFYMAQGASPNRFFCGIKLNGSDYKLSLNSVPSANSWHHFVAMRKGAELYLYIDGILKGSIPCSSSPLPYTTYYDIGAGWTSSGYKPFTGDMDDIRVYNRSLSSSEIEYLSKN